MNESLIHQIQTYQGIFPSQTVEALQEFGIPATTDALAECLRTADSWETLSHTCCFLRDSFMQPWEGQEAFRAALEASAVAAMMRKRLLHGPPWMRHELAYSMKIGLEGHKQALREAFFQFRDTDPLLLPRLVGEALWTRAVESDELHRSLLQSPVYLSRWALMECYPTDAQLDKLVVDSHPRIRREALYRRALRERDHTHPQFTKSENRQRRKEIEAARPLTFGDISLIFTNQRRKLGTETYYTVEELAAFEATLPELQHWRLSNHKSL